jgi:UDP-glucose 4-epimerase
VRALVTGGAGFIGSNLVDELVACGDAVTVVDHLSRGHDHNLRGALAGGASLVRADVTDVARMTEIFDAARPEVVYHLAAQIDVRRSIADPSSDAHANVGGTASVLEASRSAGVERVILASTAGVYGDPEQVPTPESAPLAPLSPYGAGKAAAESYMQLYGRLHGLSTLSLRMANVYGPRQDPHGEAGVIAIFCSTAVAGRMATIFGDGLQTRDFVFVGDVVAAFVAAGRSDTIGTINVSTGKETTLRELADVLRVNTAPGPARLGEINRSCLDPAVAAERLGWRARVSLEDGVGLTLAALRAVAGSAR